MLCLVFYVVVVQRIYRTNICRVQLTTTQTLKNIYPTGGVFLYLPHHPDLASEDSVGHSTCMSVLARRRAIMGSIVQPKRSCLGAAMCWPQYMQARRRAMCWGFRCTPPAVAAPRQGR